MKRAACAWTALIAAVGSFALGCEPPARPIEAGAGPASSALALTLDDKHLLVAAEDHDQLFVVDSANRQVEKRIDLPRGPAHVVLHGNGRAIVSSRYAGSISVVDLASGEVLRTIAVGSEPIGLTKLDATTVAVALAGEQSLAVVDVDTGTVEKKIDLGVLDPRGVARMPDGSVYVSHLAGGLTKVDVNSGRTHAVNIETPSNTGQRLQPEHLRSLTPSVDGKTLVIAHTQANPDVVRAPLTGDPFLGESGCGYSGCVTELGAVVPAVTTVDVDNDAVVIPTPGLSEGSEGVALDVAFGSPAPPSVLNPQDGRFLDTPIANPSAVAQVDGGRGTLVVNLGTQNVVLLRATLTGAPGDVLGTADIGHGAESVVVSHDGAHAFVWNAFDNTISDVALAPIEDPLASVFTRFGDDDKRTDEQVLAGDRALAVTTFAIAEDALSPEASIGRKLFHTANDARISPTAAVSCASCHPDGRADGRTWQFTFGPRNTPQLGGSILDTAPFHWPGDVSDVRALNQMTVLAFMGGEGLDDRSMDAIASYIDRIPAAPSAAQATGLSAAAVRGRALFYDSEVACGSCHSGQHFTDNVGHDVATQSFAGADIAVFQTPVLHGLNRSAPYLHDGSAATLEQLVDDVVATDKMGKGSHLTSAQRADLVAYLKTL